MSRGGARVGAGRKRKDLGLARLSGSRQRAAMRGVGTQPAQPQPEMPQPPVTCPDTLSEDDKVIWAELAPLATAQGTLTQTSRRAFADLCGYIVMERQLRADPKQVAGAAHRGFMQRIEAQRARFRLIPDGKPVIVASAPKDEWAEFDGPKLVKGA
jgi:hypothetical protein